MPIFLRRRRQELANMTPKEARNRRIYRAICIINSMFWMVCLGASGFNPIFKWWAFLFAAVPWILFGAIAGRPRLIETEDNNYFKPQIDTEPKNAALPPPQMHVKILDDAQNHIEQIKSAANVATGQLGASLREMVNSLEKAKMALLKSPEKLSQIQRLFTYYTPETANLLVARGKAASAGDAQRLGEIDEMLGKLEIAFSQFNSKMDGDDGRSADIDMKLLSQSLEQDFGKIESKK